MHLITLLVNLNNIVMSVKCGIEGAKAARTQNYVGLINQIVLGLVVPVLYQGLLSISYPGPVQGGFVLDHTSQNESLISR